MFQKRKLTSVLVRKNKAFKTPALEEWSQMNDHRFRLQCHKMFIVPLLCVMDKIENFALSVTFCTPPHAFLSAHTLGAFVSHSHRCNNTSSLTQKHFSFGFSSHPLTLGIFQLHFSQYLNSSIGSSSTDLGRWSSLKFLKRSCMYNDGEAHAVFVCSGPAADTDWEQ